MLDPARIWYRADLHWLALLLLPFSWLFHGLISLRRYFYQHQSQQAFSAPVIVVGNITVGGTGKTPLVIHLVNILKAQGLKPGIVSRGAYGQKHIHPYRVSSSDAAETVGDEALLLFKHANVPLFICTDRKAAVEKLLTETDCNVVISDDGLQHYRMHRDIEIVVVDGARAFGNQQLLPAGPLREPLSRLNEVDFIVTNGSDNIDNSVTQRSYVMQIQPLHFTLVNHPENTLGLEIFKNKKVHAVAAIGNPQRFFAALKKLNIEIIEHVFPDHYQFKSQDIHFDDDLPVIMTEKDAVKCKAFANENAWYLTIDVKIDERLVGEVVERL